MESVITKDICCRGMCMVTYVILLFGQKSVELLLLYASSIFSLHLPG